MAKTTSSSFYSVAVDDYCSIFICTYLLQLFSEYVYTARAPSNWKQITSPCQNRLPLNKTFRLRCGMMLNTADLQLANRESKACLHVILYKEGKQATGRISRWKMLKKIFIAQFMGMSFTHMWAKRRTNFFLLTFPVVPLQQTIPTQVPPSDKTT